jgi:hypothetical protein
MQKALFVAVLVASLCACAWAESKDLGNIDVSNIDDLSITALLIKVCMSIIFGSKKICCTHRDSNRRHHFRCAVFQVLTLSRFLVLQTNIRVVAGGASTPTLNVKVVADSIPSSATLEGIVKRNGNAFVIANVRFGFPVKFPK